MNRSHQEIREMLGSYVLGQLDDRDSFEVVEHLRSCAECQAEVSELAPLADSLRRVDLDRLRPVGIAPPPELDERISAMLPVERPASIRGTNRWKPAAGGLLVGIAVSTLIAVALPRDEPPKGPTVIAVERVESSQGVTASAGLIDHTWGVEIKLRTAGLRAGEYYDVEVIGSNGTAYDAGEILGVADKTINCNMSSSVLLADATRFVVVDKDGSEVISGDLRS